MMSGSAGRSDGICAQHLQTQSIRGLLQAAEPCTLDKSGDCHPSSHAHAHAWAQRLVA